MVEATGEAPLFFMDEGPDEQLRAFAEGRRGGLSQDDEGELL